MKGLLFLILFLSACVRQEEVSLALDWTPNTRHIGFYVAQDKGFYQKEGLNLKIIEANSKPENLVAARKADFGISYLTEVLLAYQNGLPINVVAALVRGGEFTLLASQQYNLVVSWMLSEGKRLLGQRQRTLSSWHSRWHELHVCIDSLFPQVPRKS